jgi:SAM-dependent methyltransferase
MSTIKDRLEKSLRLPELRQIEEGGFDSPETTLLQARIFKRKKILSLIYREYCRPFVESSQRASTGARMLEIGAGAGPLHEMIPGMIISDVAVLPWLHLACSGFHLPFKGNSLDRIFLMFVFHHLERVRDFLEEACRCLKPGGELIIIDPAITPFSRLYYQYCHVDRLDLKTKDWHLNRGGRMTQSNIALSWMVFFRDREIFNSLFPALKLIKVEYNTCLSFFLSGGLRIRQLLPTFFLKNLFRLENWFIRNISPTIAVTMALTLKREEGG